MAHCPSAVPNARTVIADVPGGVTLTITGGDAPTTADVRARIAALLDAQKNQGPGVHHTGTGEGGGLLGRCPIVLKDTTVVAADVDSGTKITITAKNPEEVDWLRRETRDRQADLTAAQSSSAGAGKMSHCPSAAEGATTTIKNTTDGVALVVTSSAADVTKDIRERAKHLAEIAAEEADAGSATPATHTGAGGGGGNVGRCPVVLTNTSVKVKDVPGGSQIDVKAKTPAEVAKLQAETKERAAKFQLPGAGSAAGSASVAPPPAPAPRTSK
jgi:TusA-related sulfurtransferase